MPPVLQKQPMTLEYRCSLTGIYSAAMATFFVVLATVLGAALLTGSIILMMRTLGLDFFEGLGVDDEVNLIINYFSG